MAEQQTYVRSFTGPMLEQTGPRTITGRLVPYNQATDVADRKPDGEWDVYQEGFRPGAFNAQLKSPSKGTISKISLIHRHDGGLGFLGPFTALREEPDGLYGEARIMPTLTENVEALLDAGIDELSIEFRLPRANHTEVDGNGVRWRTSVHLDQVALEPKGAYTHAQVLSYRADADEAKREQAEADEKARAEREAAELEAAEAAKVEAAIVAEREAAEDRRRRWDELTARLDNEREKQAALVREYGVTQPGGYKTL